MLVIDLAAETEGLLQRLRLQLAALGPPKAREQMKDYLDCFFPLEGVEAACCCRAGTGPEGGYVGEPSALRGVNRMLSGRCLSLVALFAFASAGAQSAQGDLTAMFAAMNVPQKPFRVFANTFYVGTHGLSAILITSPEGHILIDGGLPESAAQIAENIRALGFKPEDVKLILNSHMHFDHAGGIAELQSLSGALVAASPWSAKVLEEGMVPRDDPQFGVAPPIPPVTPVLAISDGEVMPAGADGALHARSHAGGHQLDLALL
jgi:hypothetical protein